MSGAEVVLAGASLIGAVSSVAQGNQAASLANYNSEVSRNDAIATENAAAVEERQHRKRVDRLLSTQRARAGAAGIDPLEGTPLLLMGETVEEGEIDALAIRYSGSVEAARHRSQAAADELQAKSFRAGGFYGAGTSLLTGFGKSGLLS